MKRGNRISGVGGEFLGFGKNHRGQTLMIIRAADGREYADPADEFNNVIDEK